MRRYLALLAILVAGPTIAGPFGLEKGMTLEQLKKIAVLKAEQPMV